MAMNRRKLMRIIGGTAAAPVLAGCTVLDALEDDRTEIHITGNGTFDPGGVSIRVGETIVWRNQDSQPHIISTDPADFDESVPVQVPDGALPFTSGELLANDRYTQRFDEPGDYIYACAIHPHMIGTITVA